MCLGLRCDCLREGDTEGVTVENMQTLRKPLEKCLLGVCPLFPFDLADQHAAVAASLSKGARSTEGAAAADAEGGTLVRCHRTLHARACACVCVYLSPAKAAPPPPRSCLPFHSSRALDF